MGPREVTQLISNVLASDLACPYIAKPNIDLDCTPWLLVLVVDEWHEAAAIAGVPTLLLAVLPPLAGTISWTFREPIPFLLSQFPF